MKKTTALLVSVLCLTVMGCKPHPENGGQETRAQGGHGGLRQACGTDLEKFCAADQRGRDRRMCLQSHIDQLSADCKEALASRQHGRHRNRDQN
jgi:hypothetical protein